MTKLGDISHTNPYTRETFGDTQVYARGRTVVADGGADPEREDDGQLKDIDHEPPEGAESAQEVYERGVTEDVDDV